MGGPLGPCVPSDEVVLRELGELVLHDPETLEEHPGAHGRPAGRQTFGLLTPAPRAARLALP